MGKIFTVSEVSSHNNDKDCWLIISGKVYNVTSYLDNHPGGDQVLLNVAGKDATQEFEDINHSGSARAHMEDFYIGEIETSNKTKLNNHTTSKQQDTEKSHDFIMKLLQLLVPLIILSVAIGVRFYSKSTA